MKILLFDIDGTLLLTGGAGRRAMERAFEAVFQIKNGLEGITLSGMTDPIIFRNACTQAGVSPSADKHDKFRQYYLQFLQVEIQQPNAQKRMMPGIPRLLDILHSRRDVHMGLLTGNYLRGAMIKLGYFDIDHYFDFGAYGDDHEDRNQLLPFALQRLFVKLDSSSNGHTAWVIGDTPKDVACARPHHAKAIAVATGEYDLAALAAAKPDVLLANLEDATHFIDIIEGR